MDLKDYLYKQLGSWYKAEEEIKRGGKRMDLRDYLYKQLGSWYKVEEEIKRFEKEENEK